FDCFAGRLRRVDVHVRRYPIRALPIGEDELTAWIHDRFREKDELLEEHRATGRFPGDIHPSRVWARDLFTKEMDRRTF
ncbi:MAG: hypothetical protein HC923_03925, partial [Myxococcales bacterium]|nr:hypothetical protein [Myxococcales bacterium]